MKIKYHNTFVYIKIFSYFILITKTKFTKTVKIDLLTRLEIYDIVNMDRLDYDIKFFILSSKYKLSDQTIRYLIGEK